MARIRTIKPEFFFDEELAILPFQVRLFFIGLWTQADKSGRIEDRPICLKANILPYDEFNADDALNVLSPKFVRRYQVEGRRYLQIVSFSKHQRPHNTEAESHIPPPAEAGNGYLTGNEPLNNVSEDTSMCEGEGKGREKGKEGKGESPPRLDGQKPSVPFSPVSPKEFFDLWNKATEGSAMPQAKELNADRAAKVRARLRERTLESWMAIFEKMKNTRFLNGENDRGWRASFDWIISNPSNSSKILEGKYDGPTGGLNGNGRIVGEAAYVPGKYAHLS